jgi:hypothetical protein
MNKDFSTVKYFGTLYDGIGIWRVNRVENNKIFASTICASDSDTEWDGIFDVHSGQMIDGDCDKKFYVDYKIAWVPTAKQQQKLDTLQNNFNEMLNYMLQCVKVK